uniref:P-type domain-containing protein n=1 Tax=Amphilophus citrinellus TaxID=61819 RepID=A0A3Q0QVP8_AMPCI
MERSLYISVFNYLMALMIQCAHLPCGSSALSQTQCLSIGCCFNKHPPVSGIHLNADCFSVKSNKKRVCAGLDKIDLDNK